MSRLTHKTAVALIPPEDVWPPIQAIRAEHDRQFRRWMPHVTLLYPFLPREAFAAAGPSLVSACSTIAPFTVTLREFRFFTHRDGRCTLWLVPEPHGPLRMLHAALAAAFPGCADPGAPPFEPHLSVGQAASRAAAVALAARLQSPWMPVRFQAVAASLIWRHDAPDDVFRVERQIFFRSEDKE
jgi:RNA 2',3'-cyclic 3'-phosphodiesterase